MTINKATKAKERDDHEVSWATIILCHEHYLSPSLNLLFFSRLHVTCAISPFSAVFFIIIISLDSLPPLSSCHHLYCFTNTCLIAPLLHSGWLSLFSCLRLKCHHHHDCHHHCCRLVVVVVVDVVVVVFVVVFVVVVIVVIVIVVIVVIVVVVIVVVAVVIIVVIIIIIVIAVIVVIAVVVVVVIVVVVVVVVVAVVVIVAVVVLPS